MAPKKTAAKKVKKLTLRERALLAQGAMSAVMLFGKAIDEGRYTRARENAAGLCLKLGTVPPLDGELLELQLKMLEIQISERLQALEAEAKASKQ